MAQVLLIFFFNDTATTDIYTLSLHDALPIFIDIQITLKQMLRDFIGIRVNRAKKSGMVNITSSVNSRERSGINTTGYIDHAAFLGTINPDTNKIPKHLNRKSGSARMPIPTSY